MLIDGQQAYDSDKQVVARNSIELVLYMRNVNEEQGVGREQALGRLAENFGDRRAAAAYVVEREQAATSALFERRQEAEKQIPERSQEHTRGNPVEQERTSYGFDR